MSATAAGSVVKEEEEDVDRPLENADESEALNLLGEPTPVPPGVVLDKLSALLFTGRARLRFSSGSGWGVNGVVFNTWTSFRCAGDGACRFVDEADWRTGPRPEWAESELQQLEELWDKAKLLPCAGSSQPSVLRPRLCRRAVFEFHRARFKNKRAAARPKAAVAASSDMTISAFLLVVKERLHAAGQMPKYIKLLTAVRDGAGKSDVAQILADYPDLVARMPARSAGSKPIAQAKPAAPAPEVKRETATSVVKKVETPRLPVIDVEVDILAPLRCLSTTAGFVRLALRRGRPSQRLRLLRYLELISVHGKRQVWLIRRKSADFSLAAEAMSAHLDPVEDTMTQRWAHLCAFRDFFISFAQNDQELEDPQETQRAETPKARAWNEGRLQLAMEVGIPQVFVDDPSAPTGQSGYAKRAKAAGYGISVIELA
mmetsp:Transcript_56551/g.106070  ORF Transcript_56551/g.106070 Transcript_56551/m.106070 type:complete len:430 (-) Transcript_56551:29-1318(-)